MKEFFKKVKVFFAKDFRDKQIEELKKDLEIKRLEASIIAIESEIKLGKEDDF